MKTTPHNKSTRSGFTLIEMIGVLAIIAVLAALLIPRIFTAINESRVNGAALSYNSAKSAAMSYFGKHGRFGNATGGAYTPVEIAAGVPDWGAILLSSGFTEKPFETKIAATSTVSLSAAPADSTTGVTSANSAYDLDGSGIASNETFGQLVIEALLTDVAIDDARELSLKIDGANLSTIAADALLEDVEGRVKYSTPTGGVSQVRIYIAHK